MEKQRKRGKSFWENERENLPTQDSVYLVKGIWGSEEPEEIEVYEHEIKGLCCFSEDFGSSGTEGVDDETDCHVSVQCSGLEFIRRVRDLDLGGVL